MQVTHVTILSDSSRAHYESRLIDPRLPSAIITILNSETVQQTSEVTCHTVPEHGLAGVVLPVYTSIKMCTG